MKKNIFYLFPVLALFFLEVNAQEYKYDFNGDYVIDQTDVEYMIDVIKKGSEIHDYVDLELPSGTLWATTNIGARTPEGYGYYYAWGETEYQSDNAYNWQSYKLCNGDSVSLLKYCNIHEYCYNTIIDCRNVLLVEDDAAYANWGYDWRMPTSDQLQELIDCTTHEWTIQNGVNGCKLTSNMNGKSIFLPAAGYYSSSTLYCAGSYGSYWTSSVDNYVPYIACNLLFSNNEFEIGNNVRCSGLSVRPVRAKGTHGYVDLGLPSGLLWATTNIGADSPEAYGDYFAWGETTPKAENYYSWESYKLANGTNKTITKYCNNSNYGYNGYTDNLTELEGDGGRRCPRQLGRRVAHAYICRI